jgi:hypothetical protein
MIYRTLLLCLALFISIPFANARQLSTIQMGYIRLLPDPGTTSPAGVAIFGSKSGGVVISEAGIPSTTRRASGRIYAEIGGPVNTGIALANPSDQDALVSYYFTDASGRDYGSASLKLPAYQQIAAFLNEAPFNHAGTLTGTLTFNSTIPVAAIALRSFVNERDEVLFSTVPVSPLGAGSGTAALLVPDLADGTGWSTQIVLVNPGDTTLSGTVQFYGQGSGRIGNALSVRVLINGVASSTFKYSVAPRSAYRMTTQPVRNSAELGSVRIIPASGSATPEPLAIFSYKNGNVTVSSATVTAPTAAKAVRMYVESSGVFGQIGSVQTGLSLSNPAATLVTARIEVLDVKGMPTGLSTSIDIAAGGQTAKFANQFFPTLPASFRGVLRITAPSAVALTGLRGRYNERGDLLLTTMPAYDDASFPQSEMDFPHFISGGGFSTQVILISTGPAQTGGMQLVSQEGIPLSTGLELNP